MLALNSFAIGLLVFVISQTIHYLVGNSDPEYVVRAHGWRRRVTLQFIGLSIAVLVFVFDNQVIEFLKQFSHSDFLYLSTTADIAIGIAAVFICIELVWCGVLGLDYWVGDNE